jgi:hypothetical protein
MMRWFTTNYLEDRRENYSGKILDRGFYLHDVPRLIPLCRLLGHKPVVCGTAPTRPEAPGYRWVCCDRCGVRPEPQGSLDPAKFNIGARYAGPWGDPLPAKPTKRRDVVKSLKGRYFPPGPWPTRATGELGGQLVLGRSFGGVGIELEIGAAGDDHTVSANVRLDRLGALYLHASRHGQWLQRRLNNRDHDSRVIEFAFEHNGFRWRIWAKSGEWSRDRPWWQDGSICLDPRELLWGATQNWFVDVGSPEATVVRMPDGDDHEVILQLLRHYVGRPRGKRREKGWVVNWDCPSGIPYRINDGWKGGCAYGSGVEVSSKSVEDRTWSREASVAIAAAMTRQRTRYDYSPESLAESNGQRRPEEGVAEIRIPLPRPRTEP